MTSLNDRTLQAWLRENLGLTEYRRIVRESETTVVVSKFEPGFSQDLFAIVDLIPELFDDVLVRDRYEILAREHRAPGEAPLRTTVWREASEAVLNYVAKERGIDGRSRMMVLPGIESVQAVLDTILWSAPAVTNDYTPRPGEVSEYEAFLAGAMERDLFTRFYGALDGRRVESYCPGAQFARRLIAQAWDICTVS